MAATQRQIVKGTEANPGSPTGTTFTVTLGAVLAGSSVMVFGTYSAGAQVTPTVTDSSSNAGWSVVTHRYDSSANAAGLFVAKCDNIAAAASLTITITWASAVSYRSAVGYEISGTSGYVASASNLQAGSTPGTDAITTTAQTIAGSGLLIACGFDDGDTKIPAAGTGFTDDGTWFNWEFSGFARFEHKSVSAGSVAGTFTQSAVGSNSYLTAMAVFGDSGSFTASSIGFQPSEARSAQLKPARSFNADAPIGARIIPSLAASGYAPSDALWLPGKPVRAINADAPIGSRITATLAASGYQPSEILGAPLKPQRASNADAPIGTRIVTLANSGYWPSDASRSQLKPARATNADAPIGAIIAQTLAASGYTPSDPPATWKQPNPRPRDDAVAILSLNVFGEPVVNDLPLIPFLTPQRVGMNADVFPTLQVQQATKFADYSSAVTSPYEAPSPKSQTVDAFPSIGFAPSPHFSDYSSVAPRTAAIVNQQPANDNAAAISPKLFGSFADYSASVVSTWDPRAPQSQTSDAFTALGFAPSPAFSAWVSDASKGVSVSKSSATPDVFPAISFAPNPSFALWLSDAQKSQLQAQRVNQETILGARIIQLGAFSDYSAVVNSPWGSKQQPQDQPWFLGTTQPAPGVYAEWFIASPRTWQQPPWRAQSTPIVNAFSPPPSAAFFDWFVSDKRGTAVRSRPPGESVLTGQFIPPAILTGIPWQQDLFRPQTITPVRAQDSFLAASFALAGIPWQTSEARGGYKSQRQPIADTFIGSPIVQLLGIPWQLDYYQPQKATRQPAPDSYLGPALRFGVPWQSDSPQRPQIAPIRVGDSFLGSPLTLPLSAFLAQPDAPKTWLKQVRLPDNTWALAAMPPPQLLPYVDMASQSQTVRIWTPQRIPSWAWTPTTLSPLFQHAFRRNTIPTVIDISEFAHTIVVNISESAHTIDLVRID